MFKSNKLTNFYTDSEHKNLGNNFSIQEKIKVSDILKGNKTERKIKLEKIKKNLKKQYLEIAQVLNNFEEIIDSNPNLSFIETIEKITFSEYISPKIVKNLINGFKEYFKDRQESIKKFNKYKNNKKLLIQEVYNSDYETKGEIELSVYKSCLLVIFKNYKDFENIHKSKTNLGTYRRDLNIITLKKYNKNTLKHEYQYYINSKFIKYEYEIQNFKIEDIFLELIKTNKKIAFNYIKDEIIARENENSSEFGTIIDVLTNNSPYLNDTLVLKEQINYGVQLLTQIDTLKKQYPYLYDYLLLITKDTHLKNFIGEKNQIKEIFIKIKLKIGNIILNILHS